MQRLGVLGGCFDPVHRGHLFAALLAREAAGLDEVVFVPALRPPHKTSTGLTSPEHRVAMLRAALAEEPRTSISEIELAPGGPRFTVETLAALGRQHPDAELAFIMGADSLADLPNWKEPERILSKHEVIVVVRPGVTQADRWGDRVTVVEGNPFAISSTSVRRRVAAGLPVRHLVGSAVEAYIAEKGLYRKTEA